MVQIGTPVFEKTTDRQEDMLKLCNSNKNTFLCWF